MQKVGIIYNPLAGNNKLQKKRPEKMKQILGDRGIFRVTQSKEELYQAAQEFHREGIDVLGISGGDGSNQCVLTAFREVYQDDYFPAVALLRGGTMNLLEASLKMSGSPEQRLSRLMKVTENDNFNVVEHTLLGVNGDYGYIFGNGMISNFMREYYGEEKKGGPWQAFLTATKSFWAAVTNQQYIYEPIEAKVEINGEHLPENNFMALMAATEKECGLGFKPFYRAREEQGKFHFLALSMKPRDVLWSLPAVRRGKKIENTGVHDIVTDKVVIETSQKCDYTIDGEMVHPTEKVEISAGPVVQIVKI